MRGLVMSQENQKKIEGPVPGTYNAGDHRGGNLFNVRSIESEHMYYSLSWSESLHFNTTSLETDPCERPWICLYCLELSVSMVYCLQGSSKYLWMLVPFPQVSSLAS